MATTKKRQRSSSKGRTGRTGPKSRPAARKPARKSTARKTNARKTNPRKATARKTAARKTTARKTTARKTTGRRATKDIISMLVKDHHEVETMFRRYSKLSAGSVKNRQKIVHDVIKELSRHAAVEEQILYPMISREVPGGDRLAKEGIDEHQTVKEIMSALEYSSPDSAIFDERVDALMKDVRHHIKEEEEEMFPKLRKQVSKDTLVQMGKLVEIAKKAAPTRPHPHMPATPPANLVTGVVAGVVDRVRDAGRRLVKQD